MYEGLFARPTRVARAEPGQAFHDARFDAAVVDVACARDVFDCGVDTGELEPMGGIARGLGALLAPAHEQHALPAVFAERPRARHAPIGEAAFDQPA